MTEDAFRHADGFNWMAVSWGGPDEPRTGTCSYCDAELRDGGMPLVLWNAEGWCAEFCEACQRKWWGLQCESYDDGREDGDIPDFLPENPSPPEN